VGKQFASTFLTIFIPLMFFEIAYSQWFDPQTLNCVVLLEKLVDSTYVPHGTGFLIKLGTEDVIPIAITAKHLLNREKIYISIPSDKSFKEKYRKRQIKILNTTWHIEANRLRCEFETGIKDTKRFVVHPDSALDIAAFPLEIGTQVGLKGEDLFQITSIQVIGSSRIPSRSGFSLGTNAYFIGFPMGFGSSDPISPVLRSGTIAWISPKNKEFWLDAISLGGNSGSPVFTQATLNPQFGVIKPESPKLIGIIFGHYGEKIPMLQADAEKGIVIQKVREIENWGLARAIWCDDILAVARLALDTIKP
jgi:hypothetical protein